MTTEMMCCLSSSSAASRWLFVLSQPVPAAFMISEEPEFGCDFTYYTPACDADRRDALETGSAAAYHDRVATHEAEDCPDGTTAASDSDDSAIVQDQSGEDPLTVELLEDFDEGEGYTELLDIWTY